MATVENVNIEINKKLLDELAALKAENERLKEDNRAKELEIYKVDSQNIKLQADKAELLEALKEIGNHMASKKSALIGPFIESLLSKHEAK